MRALIRLAAPSSSRGEASSPISSSPLYSPPLLWRECRWAI
jgi:hypothetical protein